MKKVVTKYLIFFLLSMISGEVYSIEKKGDCLQVDTLAGERGIFRICHDVTDVICKNVKLEERKSCEESDAGILNKWNSPTDIFNFAKGCFKSGVTSFAQFFTDFIPELIKGIWEASKSLVKETQGTWDKVKGMYESSVSLAADVYEAVQENPVAYFNKIWDKITDAVGPMVANYDCLKPQKKVEKICGLVAEWVVPPAVLARILVRGTKEVKFLMENKSFSMSEKGKLIKTLEYSEKRPVLTLAEYQRLEKEYVKLGYTAEEVSLFYKTGTFEKFNLTELKSLKTKEGQIQKSAMLGEAKASLPRERMVGKEKIDLSSDYFSILRDATGKKTLISGQIIERIVVDGNEVAFRARMIDPVTKKVYEMKFTKEEMSALSAKNAPSEKAKEISEIMEKNNLAPIDEKFKRLQREEEIRIAKENSPGSLTGVEVKEIKMEEFNNPSKKYQDGIDYEPTESPGLVVKRKERQTSSEKPLDKKLETPFKTNYVQVLTTNSMGMMTYMPAEVMRKVLKDGTEKYVIRVLDTSTNTFKEQAVSYNELKVKLRVKETPQAETQIKNFKRATGFDEKGEL